MEVFTQRLLQEHKAEAVISAPSVPYKIRFLCFVGYLYLKKTLS